ncbi:LLM class flavin-dependent oxidoreductase [Neptunitalea lumnitzerae]|uniref:LLM class flavin-dependent oxidoreductase n=1 Tax=Neptunitalea lumnitzerae TaxID=2965509 RepID=UPI0038CD64DC
MSNHAAIVKKADEVGIDMMWLRDVPFYDPNFGDTGQLYDPMVYAGWLAAQTTNIAIGTAGIVLPLRDPSILAKQVLSVDKLTGGRFILGIAGDDRYTEYPAMGVKFSNSICSKFSL